MSHYEVTVDQPNLPKGAVVNISGLGDFKNGETTVVTTQQHDAFRTFHGVNAEVLDKDGNVMRDESGRAQYEFQLGPTLPQSFIPGVTVEYMSSKEEKASKGGDKQ